VDEDRPLLSTVHEVGLSGQISGVLSKTNA